MKVAEDLFMMEVVIRCKSEMMSYNYNPSRGGRRSEPSLAAGGEGVPGGSGVGW